MTASLFVGPAEASDDLPPIELRCGCAHENPEWLPEEYRARLEADARRRAEARGAHRSLTLVPAEIDPLGADPDTPWYVFASTLNVRAQPTLDSPVVGSLAKDETVVGTYYVVAESDEEWLGFDFGGQEAYISRIGFSRLHPSNTALIGEFGELPIGREIVNRWWGMPIEYVPPDLATIPPRYTNEVPGRLYRLRTEPLVALVGMCNAALADGVSLFVSSPHRSGPFQQDLYLSAIANNGLAQRSVGPPGHSEHQLGTTVDFYNVAAGRFINKSDPEYLWLNARGADFGFSQTYRADNTGETGFVEEPWHWRYGRDAPAVGSAWMLF